METTFETTEQELAREKHEAEQKAWREAEAEKQRQHNAELVRQAAENQKQWERQSAFDAEAEIGQTGARTKMQLAEARHTVTLLKSAIANKTELQIVQREVESMENAILYAPLPEARPDAVQRLEHFRALVSLWPAREAVLRSQLEQAEEQVRHFESALDVFERKFSEAKKAVKKMLAGK